MRNSGPQWMCIGKCDPIVRLATTDKITWRDTVGDEYLNDYINHSNLCRGKRCLGGHDRLCTLCQV